MHGGHAHRREPDCRAHGGEVDPRTSILPHGSEYSTTHTMREALGFIAGGKRRQLYIADAGQGCRCTPPRCLPAETNFLVESETGGAIFIGEEASV